MKKFVIGLLLMLLFPPFLVKADGGIMPPPDSWVYETGQKAAIYFANNQETLVLQTSFSGTAKDFAYIVPTPSQPEVGKVSDDFFSNLEKMTLPNDYIVPMTSSFMEVGGAKNDSVEVLSEKQVGIFQTSVLKATDVNALYDWLKDNGYNYPVNKKYILDDYISNKWFFLVAKISAEAITPEVENNLRWGKLSPLKLVFQSDKIVYPMKISAVVDDNVTQSLPSVLITADPNGTNSEVAMSSNSDYSYVPVILYIFADHKKELNNFYVSYANWVKTNEINKLGKDNVGNYWVDAKEKMFLTKFTSTLSVSDMTNDLFPDNSKKNDLVGVETWWDKFISWGEKGWFSVIFIASSILFLLLAIFQSRLEQKKMILWYLQLFSWLAIGFMLLMIYFVTSNISYLNSNYSVGFFRDNLYLVNSFVTNLFVYLSINIYLLWLIIKQKPQRK